MFDRNEDKRKFQRLLKVEKTFDDSNDQNRNKALKYLSSFTCVTK